MIEHIDDNVGRMLDALERTGQRDNTIVIFMSDQEEALGDHGLLLIGCRFYEGLARAPLTMSWLGVFLERARRQALVELLDIAPTLLDLAGLPIRERMQGISLRNLLADAGAEDHHRDFVRCEYYRGINPSMRHNNLWDDPALIKTEVRLMQLSFDALALAADNGPKQITWF